MTIWTGELGEAATTEDSLVVRRSDIGLAALALLVEESNPAHKETMVRLIMNMLAIKP